MRWFKRSVLAGALALAVSGPASAQFTNIYFFGDSLTDAGAFKPVLPAGTGLFTTNPGPVYPTLVGQQLGFAVTPGTVGGNDFAQGGARVTQLPGFGSGPAVNAIPVSTQVGQLLARGPLDPNALYVVWAGANDVFTQISAAGAGTITAAQAQAGVSQAATELVGQLARLQANGARYIVVITLPDIGRTPAGTASGQPATFTGLSSLFNGTFIAGMDQVGIQALRLNAFGLLNEVIANPGLYGFTNATVPACGSTSSLICTAANFVAPNAAQTFLFADGVHPTTAGHALLAQYIEATLAAPQQIAVLAEAPLNVDRATFRSLDARMTSAINAPGRSKYEAWAAYDYANPDIKSGFITGDGTLDTVSVGFDAKISQRLLVGAAFAYTDDKVDFSQSGFKLRETTGTLYAGYGEGPWYVGATVGASDLDYRDVHRDIALGAATRTERGETKGYATTGRVLAGYWFNLGNIVHGPRVAFTYQDITVRAYTEQGSASTTMAFDQQRRKSAVTSLGWQVAGTFGAFRPFLRASWENEMKDDQRSVGASVFGTGGGSFTVPAYRPDKDYALFTIGASTDIGRVTAFVTGSGTGGKSDGNDWGVTVGVRVPL